jgi:hypothetical protein
MGGILAQCPICKERKELTAHHVKELGKDENGSFRKLGLCNECHVWHEKYINVLKTFGYDPEKP